MDEEPLIRWDWIGRNWPNIQSLLADHVVMAVLPVVFALLIALPLGLASVRWRWLYQPTVGVMNVVYSLPSLAVFIVLIPVTGLAERATVIVPLTFYALAVLIPAVVDGVASVPAHVRQSAVAMGFRPLRRLVSVELPIAVPVVLAGVRVATVSSISLVSVGALVGRGGLGYLFIDGWQRQFPTPIVVGIVLVVLLAVAADGLLVAAQRVLTPWSRARRAA
ncbi:osmoprotectant transport system permease protein [Sinosporangium album]|uniref:Osmoprotectant transport system permease protein n=1 Tax=Sinosporangium album TaxID=504805 RepID=A0A1G8F3J5_9ACTN|nr:ABC transporter permease [Sinosporangium album]SDH76703.1 osmoprotectant transport system permease protein [Sinosporangium album]